MNTHELRQMRKNKVSALWQKIAESDGKDEMAIFDQIQEVEAHYQILIKESGILNDWGIPAEEWATLSQTMKKIIVDMSEEANRYEQLRDDLHGWLEQAP